MTLDHTLILDEDLRTDELLYALRRELHQRHGVLAAEEDCVTVRVFRLDGTPDMFDRLANWRD